MSRVPDSPAFDAEIQRLYVARQLWHKQSGLEMVHLDVEKALVLAQWQRSQEGDDLAFCIRQVLEFLNPDRGSQLRLLLSECSHRLKGTGHRKTKMDLAIEALQLPDEPAKSDDSDKSDQVRPVCDRCGGPGPLSAAGDVLWPPGLCAGCAQDYSERVRRRGTTG